MMAGAIKRLNSFVNWLGRSNSPIFYRIYRYGDHYPHGYQKTTNTKRTTTRHIYLVCWVFWDKNDHWLYARFPQSDLNRVLRILNREYAVLVDTDLMPREICGKFEDSRLVVMPWQGPQGQQWWTVVTRHPNGIISPPYDNVFEREDVARAWAAQIQRELSGVAIVPIVNDDREFNQVYQAQHKKEEVS